MKSYITPPFLQKGDKAIIISPSGYIDSGYIDSAKTVLERWGLKVKMGNYAFNRYGRFGGTVEQRLEDLQNAMDSDDIKLIFCSRGGYGVVHLLNKLNFDRIKQYPKWLVGYSDITALHLAFLQNGIASLHAPMTRHLADNPLNEASQFLNKSLFESNSSYTIASHNLNRAGKAEGHLFGGNLAVLAGLMGTPYMDVPDNGILFIEDIAESPYKIDRMMWQLKLSGTLEQLSGLVIGQFSEYEEDSQMMSSVYESIRNIVDEYNFPLVFDFPVGHVDDNRPLIHGGSVQLTVDSENTTLKFL